MQSFLKSHILTSRNLDYPNRFARIRYIYKIFDRRTHVDSYWAHVQWLQHGSETDIGELAAPNELFMSYECGNIGLATIKQLIQVHQVSEKFIPPPDMESSIFFCRFAFAYVSYCA
jgi:DNA (cytosine-5)-methyltransferase 1